MGNIFDLFRRIEKKEDKMPIGAILVGLGNPGDKYEGTRHNAGFMAIDYIMGKLNVKADRAKFHSLVCEGVIGGVRVLIMKPQTFMNNSGTAVAEAASFYKIPPERILVLHDEISFDPGIIRIRRKGSSGGHNGLKSIIALLGSEDFPRIKIGVGRKPSPEYDLVDWVLGRFPKTDALALQERFEHIANAAELILGGRIEEAMNLYSG